MPEQPSTDASRQRRAVRRPPPLGLAGPSAVAARLRRLVSGAASLSVPVLIRGEPGVGRREVARFMHDLSPRSRGPFAVIDCGSLDEGAARLALLGTGDGLAPAATERARGGSLLLHEVGGLAAPARALLLGLFRDGLVASGPDDEGVRVLSTTRRDLSRACEHGLFRVDLLHRLAAVTITLPPLRERAEDLPTLARRCLSDAERGSRGLAPDALDLLTRHGFPGNLAELRKVLASASALATDGVVRAHHLPALRAR